MLLLNDDEEWSGASISISPDSTLIDLHISVNTWRVHWLEELEMYAKLDKHKQDLEDRLLQPDDEHSTELGEIPHKRHKGIDINPYRNYVNSVFGWYL